MFKIGTSAILLVLALINQIVAISAAHDKNFAGATYYILVAIFLLLLSMTLTTLFREK